MGGGGRSAPAPQPVPAAPAPIDYDAMARASIRVAQAQTKAEEESIKRLYPQYIGMQFGTADQLAGRLDNSASQQARAIAQQELGRDMGPSALERQFSALGMSAMDYRPDQVQAPTDIRNVQAINAQAARMGAVRDVQGVNAQRVADVRSRNVGAGALGGSLLSEAQQRVESGGRLSAEASRDAVQSARAGMAARGMATGNAGLAAELLNRDRYARTRDLENLGFAQGVQNADVQRRMSNAEMALQAARGNQAMAGQMSLADQAAMMDAQRLNQASDLTRGQANAQFAQQAALANQAAGMDAQRLNQVRDTTLGQFFLNAQLANQEANMNQFNNNRAFVGQAGQQAFQNDMARSQRRLGLGGLLMDMDPYRQALGPAFQLGMGTMGNTTQQVGNIFSGALNQSANVSSFNTNMAASNRNAILNSNAAMQAAAMQAGAMNNAATMGMIGSIGGGLLGGAGFALSDKREKKDIKPLGKAGSVLGLTAYEFSYKGDGKKRKGFMAQDVQKVLPEAVAEVDYKGKKRLAIKPAVIGAALAEELMAAKAA